MTWIPILQSWDNTLCRKKSSSKGPAVGESMTFLESEKMLVKVEQKSREDGVRWSCRCRWWRNHVRYCVLHEGCKSVLHGLKSHWGVSKQKREQWWNFNWKHTLMVVWRKNWIGIRMNVKIAIIRQFRN